MSSPIPSSAVCPGATPMRREPLNQFMLRCGPTVNPNDLEIPDSLAVEVMVLWGQNVLHVSYVVPPNGFVVGETTDHAICDFFMPEELLGVPRLALVVPNDQTLAIAIPPQAAGYFDYPGEPRIKLETVRRRATPWSEMPGGCLQPLPANGKASLHVGDFTFQFAAVAVGRPCKKGLAACADTRMFGFFGWSLAAVTGFVTAMAYPVPSQNSMDDESFDTDQIYVIRQYLRASAERESEVPTELAKNVDPTNQEGSSGTRAKGEEGKMGTSISQPKNARYTIQGPRDNPDPHLSHEQLLRVATTKSQRVNRAMGSRRCAWC